MNDQTGRVVRTTSLAAPVEDVWAAIADPDQLTAWLGEVVDLELEPGGRITIREADGALLRGSVEIVDPPARVVVRWRRHGVGGVGPARRVSFELVPDVDGTRITLTESAADAVALLGSAS